MKSMLKILSVLSLFAIAGCSSAPKATEVTAAYIPTAQYAALDCQQLISEAESIRRATPALEAAVDQHRKTQTGVEVVTWVLFWPAAFLLDKGTEYSAPLAQARGQLQAIHLQLQNKKCGG